ncbi:M48 family metalloprotease [Kiritimatiellota bacterium B12222]|nr:M48 family metalloprotease [Kiritimatiellota bacterium B12222]
MKTCFTTLVLCCLLICGCATNPVTGRTEFQLLSEQEEISMGTQEYPLQIQLSGGPYTLDPELSDYVNRVGQKLANESDRPQLPYEFTIVNDSSWNAWALPGGKIAINRGLLESLSNESELAAVLGHEIVHAAARHSAQQIERGMWMQAGLLGVTLSVDPDLQNIVYDTGSMAAGITMLSYSRDAETEADYYGMRYMKKAGYDPTGAVTLQQLFADNMSSAGTWLDSHPASIERVRKNKAALQSLNSDGYLGSAEYRIRTRNLQARASAYRLYDEGVKYLANNNPQQALVLSLQARNQVPQEALFYALSAEAYEKTGNRKAALQAWDQTLQRNQEWFYFWLKRGLLNESMGNRAQAASDFQQSYALLPTDEAQAGYQRTQ